MEQVEMTETKMKAMMLEQQKSRLTMKEIDRPEPTQNELLIKVEACAVCRTDLHVVDGDLTEPKLPLVIGHEIVGTVIETGSSASDISKGDRVGVPWLGKTCGHCRQCQAGRENLCDQPQFTGYTRNGGYAEYTTANARYSFKIPDSYTAVEAAPLLCAGLIGWRSYKMAGTMVTVTPHASRASGITSGSGDSKTTQGTALASQAQDNLKNLGIYGFGAAAHIIAQVAIYEGKNVYAFTRSKDTEGQNFALSLGCVWAGSSEQAPPEPLDAAIIFAPVGGLVPLALKAVVKGGAVVCGGIHMSDIPSFPYADLWQERKIVSVANLTREDAIQFLTLAPKVPVRAAVQTYPLQKANQALDDLRSGRLVGAAVLIPD